MILTIGSMRTYLDSGSPSYDPKDPFVISPAPEDWDDERNGETGLDLRLGCWMSVCKRGRQPLVRVSDPIPESAHMRPHYARFGDSFVLHPQHFILGVTLEWLRMPRSLAAYVVGKSSWGRRGLVIATATGVHPGFTGCLTLEITNLGEIPIEIYPGMAICQLFCHQAAIVGAGALRGSTHAGSRKPRLGVVTVDPIAEKLRLGSMEGERHRKNRYR